MLRWKQVVANCNAERGLTASRNGRLIFQSAREGLVWSELLSLGRELATQARACSG